MEIVRLGQGVDATGRLAPDALARTLPRARGVRGARSLAAAADAVRMVATSATGTPQRGRVRPRGHRDPRRRRRRSSAAARRPACPSPGRLPSWRRGRASGSRRRTWSSTSAADRPSSCSGLPVRTPCPAAWPRPFPVGRVQPDVPAASSRPAAGQSPAGQRQPLVRPDVAEPDIGERPCPAGRRSRLDVGWPDRGHLRRHRLRPDDRAAPALRPAGSAEIAAATTDIDAAISRAAAEVPVQRARTLVGLAGSVTTVAAIALGLPAYDAAGSTTPGSRPAQVHEVTQMLLGQTRAQRGHDRRHAPRPGRRDRRRARWYSTGYWSGSASPRSWPASTTSWTASPGPWWITMADEPAAATPSAPAAAPSAAAVAARAPAALAPTPAGLAAPAAAPAPARCRPAPAGRMIRPRRLRRSRPAPPTSGHWPRLRARSPSWRRGSRSAGPARGWSGGASRSRRKSAGRSPAERYWGRPVPGWGDEQPRHAHRRPGPGRARREPHRADLHRRPQRRLPLRLAVAVRPGRPADERHRRGRPAAARRAHGRCGPLRAAREQAVGCRAGRLRALADRGTRAGPRLPSASSSASVTSPGRLSGRSWAVAGFVAAQAAAGVRARRRGPARRGSTRWRQRRRPVAVATRYSSAATTRASRTPLPAG